MHVADSTRAENELNRSCRSIYDTKSSTGGGKLADSLLISGPIAVG